MITIASIYQKSSFYEELELLRIDLEINDIIEYCYLERFEMVFVKNSSKYYKFPTINYSDFFKSR